MKKEFVEIHTLAIGMCNENKISVRREVRDQIHAILDDLDKQEGSKNSPIKEKSKDPGDSGEKEGYISSFCKNCKWKDREFNWACEDCYPYNFEKDPGTSKEEDREKESKDLQVSTIEAEAEEEWNNIFLYLDGYESLFDAMMGDKDFDTQKAIEYTEELRLMLVKLRGPYLDLGEEDVSLIGMAKESDAEEKDMTCRECGPQDPMGASTCRWCGGPLEYIEEDE